jgi:hypothetical protein
VTLTGALRAPFKQHCTLQDSCMHALAAAWHSVIGIHTWYVRLHSFCHASCVTEPAGIHHKQFSRLTPKLLPLLFPLPCLTGVQCGQC